jgi:hypothetical protein
MPSGGIFDIKGKLEKYGEVPGGSVVAADIIASSGLGNTPSNRNRLAIRELWATAEKGCSNTRVTVEVSADGISGWTVKCKTVIPDGGDRLVTLQKPIYVEPGEFWRVRGIQTTAGAMSAAVYGETEGPDVKDI